MLIFEWDEQKAASNRRKHGVSFEEAAQVFDDPFARAEQDRVEDSEARWRTIGMTEGVILLVVAHTSLDNDGDEVIRIISARHATRKERIRYEQCCEKESW